MHALYENFKYFTDKRFSTLSGTLVYFLIMSVTPFLFWITLLLGEVDFSEVLSHEVFTAVSPIINYLQTAAVGATGSAGVILLITSLWSSTNFFYHLRRSGEIIYENRVYGAGLKLRLSSLLAVLVAVLLVALAAGVPFLSLNFLSLIMPLAVAQTIALTFVIMLAFFIAYLLNVFACPYKQPFSVSVQGAMLTLTLWIACAAGFSVYLRFSDPQKLYGAIAVVIVFMLWCYLMVNSLVIGIIYNGRFIQAQSVAKQLSVKNPRPKIRTGKTAL